MRFKKLFFPIGGGLELEERLHGCLLVAKHFNAHLEVLASRLPKDKIFLHEFQSSSSLMDEMKDAISKSQEKELQDYEELFKSKCQELGVEFSKDPQENKTTANMEFLVGYRSVLVAQESKFCDLVVVAAPPNGNPTATFEAAILESGKPALIIPRKMQKISTENIIIGWNNSAQISKAISQSLGIMQTAKRVHIITSEEYTTQNLTRLKALIKYLALHGINATYEIVKTTKIPGQALVENAHKGGFDLIVAGAFSHEKLIERVFGGTTKFLLKNCEIPTFIAH